MEEKINFTKLESRLKFEVAGERDELRVGNEYEMHFERMPFRISTDSWQEALQWMERSHVTPTLTIKEMITIKESNRPLEMIIFEGELNRPAQIKKQEEVVKKLEEFGIIL